LKERIEGDRKMIEGLKEENVELVRKNNERESNNIYYKNKYE
jgi:hypothetical protein